MSLFFVNHAAYLIHLRKIRIKKYNIQRRLLRDMHNPFELDDRQFIKLFRINKYMSKDLCDKLRDLLNRTHPRGLPVHVQMRSSDDSLCPDCVRSLNRLKAPIKREHHRVDGGVRHRRHHGHGSGLKRRLINAALNLDSLYRRNRAITENAVRSPSLGLDKVAFSSHDQEPNVRGPDADYSNVDGCKTKLDDTTADMDDSTVNTDDSASSNSDDSNRSDKSSKPPPRTIRRRYSSLSNDRV